MNMIDQILEQLNKSEKPANGDQFSLFHLSLTESDVFYGKNAENQIVFATYSQNTQLRPSLQRTKKLVFWFNAKCNIMVDKQLFVKHMNVLICLSRDESEIIAFIRLTLAFAEEMVEQDSRKLHELFTSLTHLFANELKANPIELQGFFGELYAIRYYNKLGLNLSSYWQRKEKLKFDFSLSQQKKVEVKSTVKDIRIHHFKHEQLLSDLYDICVVSVMLRADDSGLSLLQLVSEVQEIATGNFDTLMYIEDFIKNFDEDELKEIKFDKNYLDRNIHVYRAADIPKFQEEQPKGVSKTEYDSNLSNSTYLTDEEFIDWAQKY